MEVCGLTGTQPSLAQGSATGMLYQQLQRIVFDANESKGTKKIDAD